MNNNYVSLPEFNKKTDNTIFEKNTKYNVLVEDLGMIECIWDGRDFYPNENKFCYCKESIYVSGICIGVPFDDRYRILAVEEFQEYSPF